MSSSSTGGEIRWPAVSGRFYPAGADALREEVQGFAAAARGVPAPAVKALVAPHAGYVYSGPIAASAFAAWRDEPTPVRRIVLIGPSHYAEFPGVAVSLARGFATPLGEVPLDAEGCEQVRRVSCVRHDEGPHRPEHCLEVELPFLQNVLDEFSIVPLLVGDAGPDEVAAVLDAVWGGPETRIVVSSDLSHYQSYRAAQAIDQSTAEAIEALDGGPLDSTRACGYLAIQGLIEVAARRGLGVRTLDLRNSGDTAGPRDRVVGYGAFTFQGPAAS